MPDDPPSNGPRLSTGLLVVGTEMASFTVVGLLIDYALGTLPGFTVGLTLVGVAVAFLHLVQMAKTLSAKKKPPDAGTGGGP